MSTTASFDPNLTKRWASIKPAKLSKEIDTDRLREPRPLLIDEPLFSSNSMFSADFLQANRTDKYQLSKKSVKEPSSSNKKNTSKERPNK